MPAPSSSACCIRCSPGPRRAARPPAARGWPRRCSCRRAAIRARGPGRRGCARSTATIRRRWPRRFWATSPSSRSPTPCARRRRPATASTTSCSTAGAASVPTTPERWPSCCAPPGWRAGWWPATRAARSIPTASMCWSTSSTPTPGSSTGSRDSAGAASTRPSRWRRRASSWGWSRPCRRARPSSPRPRCRRCAIATWPG